MTHLLDKLTRERNAFRELDNELTELCELSGYDTEARNIEIRDMENELDQMRSNIAAILRQIRDDTENEQTSYPT